MADINDLDRQIQEKLKGAEERLQLRQNHLQQRMREFQQRQEQYTEIADRLMQQVICPRIRKLAEHFANAKLPGSEQSCHRCLACFEHTPHFPATTRLELSVSHDGTYENLTVLYNLEILPVFFRFPGEDKLTIPVKGVDEEGVATWVQDKIISFVDTYLRLEVTDQYRMEHLALDPVCGMRVDRAFAPGQVEYRGQVYYFCVEECKKKFMADPDHHLRTLVPHA
jgi:YHS domain-containing protein